jgi:hypothetical protein
MRLFRGLLIAVFLAAFGFSQGYALAACPMRVHAVQEHIGAAAPSASDASAHTCHDAPATAPAPEARADDQSDAGGAVKQSDCLCALACHAAAALHLGSWALPRAYASPAPPALALGGEGLSKGLDPPVPRTSLGT